MNAVRRHEERRRAALFPHGKGLLQLLATPCFDGVECHAQGSSSSLDLVEGRFLVGICWVPKKGDARHVRHGLFQKLEPFCRQARAKYRQACDVSTWVREARDEAAPHWIANAGDDDGDSRRRLLGGESRGCSPGHDDVHVEPNELGREVRQPLVSPLRVSLLECNALSFHVAEIAQAYPERLPRRRVGGEQPDPWDRRRRLRPGGERYSKDTQSKAAQECAPLDRCKAGTAH